MTKGNIRQSVFWDRNKSGVKRVFKDSRMTRNTNFDDVRVGTTIGFAHPQDHIRAVTANKPYQVIKTGSNGDADFKDDNGNRRFLSEHARWEEWGGYVISQPDEAPTGQPPVLHVEGTYAWHIQDVSTDPEAPPCARFEMMFDEDWKPEHIAAVLSYLGIETKFLSEEWPASIDDEPLTRADVEAVELPAWVEKGGWTLATAWDTEDSEIMMRFVRPAIDEAMDREARG